MLLSDKKDLSALMYVQQSVTFRILYFDDLCTEFGHASSSCGGSRIGAKLDDADAMKHRSAAPGDPWSYFWMHLAPTAQQWDAGLCTQEGTAADCWVVHASRSSSFQSRSIGNPAIQQQQQQQSSSSSDSAFSTISQRDSAHFLSSW